jgi:protein transport protein SEC61 subunit gamma-like protein
MQFNLKEKLENYSRVLKIAKKPNWSDFSDTARICLIGVAVVGVIGFLLYMISVTVGL